MKSSRRTTIIGRRQTALAGKSWKWSVARTDRTVIGMDSDGIRKTNTVCFLKTKCHELQATETKGKQQEDEGRHIEKPSKTPRRSKMMSKIFYDWDDNSKVLAKNGRKRPRTMNYYELVRSTSPSPLPRSDLWQMYRLQRPGAWFGKNLITSPQNLSNEENRRFGVGVRLFS